MSEHIAWAGSVGQDEIRAQYDAANVSCLPSFAEGIPVVRMEAMPTELPVIANQITGIPELVDHEVSGLFTRSGRTDLLAEALTRLAVDGELRLRMGRLGRKKVCADFDYHKSAAVLRELFTRELAKGQVA